MREIIRADAWRGIRELIAELGGEPHEILAAAHVDVASLEYPDRYLSLRSFMATLEIAAERLGRPDFGLRSGSIANMSVLGALSIAALHSPTGREGLQVAGRYIHIHNPALSASIAPIPHSTRDFAKLGFRMTSPPTGHTQFLERQLGSLHKGLRQLCGPDYRPLEVRFLNQPLSPPPVYRKMFGIAPVFGRDEMGIVVERAVLDAYQPGRSDRLRELAEGYLESLGPQTDDSFTVRVTSMTRGLLSSGDCSPEQAARALGVHARTLQRHLKEEGTSFETIKDGLRRETAEALLGQINVPFSHIAYMLNYADTSALSRSCRRWFGETPRAHRARLAEASLAIAPAAPLHGIKSAEAARRG
jgi:AraC-like DNA-binding protein